VKMAGCSGWDLMVCYSSALDAVQHYFWNYCDESCEEYRKGNPFESVIREFYILYDEMVARLIASASPGTGIVILSDHGHGGRPRTLINVNEILRQNGLISNEPRIRPQSILNTLNAKSIEMVSRYDLGWIVSGLFRLMPALKDRYAIPAPFDRHTSVAYVTDLSGIKAYTYGGVRINRTLIDEAGYGSLREEIIGLLKAELEGKYEWIIPREELYEGPYLPNYPDILIQLKEGYGLGNRINCPVFTEAVTSNIVPGSHRGDTPVFFLVNAEGQVTTDEITLMHVAPTVLEMLGIDSARWGFDEESILTR
jgi:predicted AlkP superfamily phosphohydrolase/phosphomutase